MNLYTVAFAGSTVTLLYDTKNAEDFLSLLFTDVSQQDNGGERQHYLSLIGVKGQSNYQLHDDSTLLYCGRLGVRFAAHIYDTVIFHLLNKAGGGVALHAGGVICKNRVTILPGQSGSGKSTMTAWLTSKNCSYLTDELIFLPIHAPYQIQYFSRPLCLKPESVYLLRNLLTAKQMEDVLIDQHGAIIPHRLLNPDFKKPLSPPSLIILPDYDPESNPRLELISKARLGTLLMGCHVNARNLVDHGFKQILDIARSTPAYRLSYSNFQAAERLLDKFLPA